MRATGWARITTALAAAALVVGLGAGCDRLNGGTAESGSSGSSGSPRTAATIASLIPRRRALASCWCTS